MVDTLRSWPISHWCRLCRLVRKKQCGFWSLWFTVWTSQAASPHLCVKPYNHPVVCSCSRRVCHKPQPTFVVKRPAASVGRDLKMGNHPSTPRSRSLRRSNTSIRRSCRRHHRRRLSSRRKLKRSYSVRCVSLRNFHPVPSVPIGARHKRQSVKFNAFGNARLVRELWFDFHAPPWRSILFSSCPFATEVSWLGYHGTCAWRGIRVLRTHF